MPKASALSRILHPFPGDKFVHDHFQRRALFIRGRKDKFAFLFRRDDFARNLDQVTQIRAVFPELRQARIAPRDVEHMYEAGATICVTGMEKAHPKLARFAEKVRTELNYAGKVSFRAYLSPPGSGFDLHFDARITTSLQIAGSKRWWYAELPAVPFPAHNSGREPGRRNGYRWPEFSELRSIVLSPGDLICLPAGTWHAAEGTSMSLALNMAFDHNGAGALDSLVHILRARLAAAPEWREPLPVAAGQGRSAPAHVMTALRNQIDLLQRELSALRANDAQLTRAWRQLVRGA